MTSTSPSKEGVAMEVIQRFRKSAVDATTATLLPSTTSYAEAKPSHLAATQIVLTFTARPTELFGAVADDVEYEVVIRPVT